jgi:Tfp pilus assembly protein PilN
MRPVNLLSPGERHGELAPMRTGPLPYIIVGALVAVLVGVTVLVLTGNQISESEADLVTLKRENAVAKERAERLSPYTQFQALHDQRVATVTTLADSRFDWQRVMRELSLILPSNVWLTGLTASASPLTESGGGEAEGSSRGSIAGPALEVNGCASGQVAVAGFVTALKDIDGVTRVGVQTSELAGLKGGAGVSAEGDATASGASGASDCRTREFIARFEIVIAFDAAPVSSTEAGAEVAVPAPETTESSSTESTEGG